MPGFSRHMYLSEYNLGTFFSFRANASLNLESQIKKVDGLVSGFEKSLSEDGPVPDVPNAMKAHTENIQVRKYSSLHSMKNTTGLASWHVLNCRTTLDMFRPSEGLWQEQRMTWRSWVRIWRLRSSCVAPCSRATRSTAQTLTAKEEKSSSCRCAMKTSPTSLMRGEGAHRKIKRLDSLTSVQICFLCVNVLKNR